MPPPPDLPRFAPEAAWTEKRCAVFLMALERCLEAFEKSFWEHLMEETARVLTVQEATSTPELQRGLCEHAVR